MKSKSIPLGKTGDSRTRRKQTSGRAGETTLQVEPRSFTSYLIEKNFSDSTTLRYVKDSSRFLQWLKTERIEPEEVRYADVLHFIQQFNDRIKRISVVSLLNAVKHYFDYLVDTETVTSNPAGDIEMRGIKRKTLYNILTRQELDALYLNYEIPKEDDPNRNQNWFIASQLTAKRNKVIVGLLTIQGVTTNELSHLTLQDVKLRDGKIYIAGTRRSEERELKLEAYQVLDLMEYIHTTRVALLQLTGTEGDKLFVSIGKSEHFNVLKPLLKKLYKLNNKVTSVKQIRASVITHWLKLYNLRQVQYMAGHRYVSSTEGYMVNNMEELQSEINKYHPIQ